MIDRILHIQCPVHPEAPCRDCLRVGESSYKRSWGWFLPKEANMEVVPPKSLDIYPLTHPLMPFFILFAHSDWYWNIFVAFLLLRQVEPFCPLGTFVESRKKRPPGQHQHLHRLAAGRLECHSQRHSSSTYTAHFPWLEVVRSRTG